MNKKIEIEYQELDSWKDLSFEDHVLVEKANQIMDNAYAPYSKFKVGASLRLTNNEIITGSNQENIAYPSGLCAERVALFYAGANYPNESIETLCIIAKGDLVPVETILSPCGSCRQVMIESEKRQDKEYRIILVSQNGKTLIFNSALDLLPLAFGV